MCNCASALSMLVDSLTRSGSVNAWSDNQVLSGCTRDFGNSVVRHSSVVRPLPASAAFDTTIISIPVYCLSSSSTLFDMDTPSALCRAIRTKRPETLIGDVTLRRVCAPAPDSDDLSMPLLLLQTDAVVRQRIFAYIDIAFVCTCRVVGSTHPDTVPTESVGVTNNGTPPVVQQQPVSQKKRGSFTAVVSDVFESVKRYARGYVNPTPEDVHTQNVSGDADAGMDIVRPRHTKCDDLVERAVSDIGDRLGHVLGGCTALDMSVVERNKTVQCARRVAYWAYSVQVAAAISVSRATKRDAPGDATGATAADIIIHCGGMETIGFVKLRRLLRKLEQTNCIVKGGVFIDLRDFCLCFIVTMK